MAFEKPPSMNDFNEIIPEAPKDVTPLQKRVRILLAVFGVFILLLGLLNLWKSDLTAPLRGTGTVRGVAVDTQGQPFSGDIFVEGTTLGAKTNADGSFELKNIPAGKRLIVVADAVSGREFPVVIRAGQTTNLGTVQFQSTATP
jgi:hypothetical protein